MKRAPGTVVSTSAAVVIDAEESGGRIFCVLPGNKVTPWVIWASYDAETGSCFSGTYYYDNQFEQAVSDWLRK